MALPYETGSLEGDKALAKQLTVNNNTAGMTPQNTQLAPTATTSVPQPQTSPNIPVADIAPAPTLNLPQPQVTMDEGAYASAIKQGQSSLDQYIKQLTPTKSAAQQERDSLLGDIRSLLPDTVGQGKDLQKEQEKLGINKSMKELMELSNAIRIKSAQFDQMFANAELQPGVPFSVVQGQQGAIRRQQLAEVGVMNARALGLQGQIELAQDLAQQAVDFKYADKIAEIEAKQKQLELIQPLLDEDEVRTAEAIKQKREDDLTYIEEQKAKTKENLELAWAGNVKSKFANKNGEFFRVSDGKPYDNVEEFFADAGVSSFEEAYRRGLITDMDAETIDNIKFVSELRSAYYDAGINPYSDSPEEAVQKLFDSNKYLMENRELYGPPEIFDIGGGLKGVWNPETNLFEPIELPAGAYNSQSLYIGQDGGELKLTAGQSATLTDFDSTIAQSQEALSLLDAGVKTGPLEVAKYGINKLLNRADDQQMSYAQKIAMIRADFQKAISGATVSEEERKRLEAFLPVLADQETVAKSKLQNLITELSRKKEFFLENAGGQINPNYLELQYEEKSNNPDFVGPTNSNVKGYSGSVGKMQPITFNEYVVERFPEGSRPTQTGAASDQCGYYARNVVKNMGYTYPTLGDGLNEKRAAVQKYGVPLNQARVGSVVVTGENPTYGHIAVVTEITPQGFKVTESNYKQSGRISHDRIIPFNRVIGIINPRKA